MRHVILFMITFITFACNGNKGEQQSIPVKDTLSRSNNLQQNIWVIPANKSYIEPYRDSQKGIFHDQLGSNNNLQKDITSWTSPDINVCWYLNFTHGKYSLHIVSNIEIGNVSKFLISLTGIDNPDLRIEKEVSMKGISEFVLYPNILDVIIPVNGFYKLEIKPVRKTGDTFMSIRSLVLRSDDNDPEKSVRYANWLLSPSVYLSYINEGNKEYDWLYTRILVPHNMDPVYSFYQGIGFYRGYLGIQVNSETERRVLFSIWDSSEEALDRSKVKKEDRVELVAKGDGVTAQGFENQGTGGQSFAKYPWVTDIPVDLLANVKRLKGNKLLFTAWFRQKQQGDNKWHFIASWKAPKDNRYFKWMYSFVMNFSETTGQYRRECYFLNASGRIAGSNEWDAMTKATIHQTDGGDDSRSDCGGGVDKIYPEGIYLWSGGYTKSDTTENEVVREVLNLPKINIDSLSSFVDHLNTE